MAKQGFGAFVQLSATTISDNTTGLIAEVTSVGLPNPTTGTTETTNHASSGGIREYLPDLIDIGAVPIAINFVPGGVTDLALATAAFSRALYYFKITVPTTTGTPATWCYTGQCIVTDYNKAAVGVAGHMTATLTFKPTGPVTRVAGT